MIDAGISDVLNYASYICYAISVVFLILAIILFYKLEIKNVIYELSGKAKVASTQKMNESYAVTGSLRNSSGLTGSFDKSGVLSGEVPTSTRTSGKIRPEVGNGKKTGQTGKTRMGSAFTITKDVMIVHTDERIII